MLLHLFLLVTLQVLSLFGQYYAGDVCAEENGKKFVIHETKLHKKCCESKNCHAGFESVICSQDKGPGECHPCKIGYFNPDGAPTEDGVKCRLWRECGHGQKVHKPGTKESDRICTCDTTNGYYNAKKFENPDNCVRLSCEAGSELNHEGKCKSCGLATYKSEAGYHSCIPKTKCEEHGQVRDTDKTVSAFEDVVCKNTTAFTGIVVELPESSEQTTPLPPTSSAPSVKVGRAVEKAHEGNELYIGLGLCGAVLIILILVGIFCWKKGFLQKRHQDCEARRIEQPEPQAASGPREHDETIPLRTTEPTQIDKVLYKPPVSRQPTECDDYTGYGAEAEPLEPSAPKYNRQYNRQQTQDSGYARSSSESVSLQMDGSASDEVLNSTPIPESTKTPLTLNVDVSAVGDGLSSTPTPQSPKTPYTQCDKCGKSVPSTVYHHYHIGNNSLVNFSGDYSTTQMGHNNHQVVSSPTEDCSGCETDSGEGSIEIERTKDESDAASSNSNTKLQRTLDQTPVDSGVESFFRKGRPNTHYNVL